MGLIAVPLGGILAFLMIRTDLPGRGWIEPLLLIPVFVSPMVLGFGYVVSAGPVGFYSVWAKELFGGVPWNVYSLTGIAVIAGLTHVPHVYLYSSSALKSLGSDVEEAARMTGSTPFQVARDVSLPMVTPSLLFSGVLVFFLGFEIFGLPLVLGDPEGHLVLATYLYKLTNKLGTPSYHLMAAVAVCIVAMTFPLVMLQRYLLKNAGKFVTVKGKAGRQRPLPLGGWRWVAAAILVFWLFITVVVPLSGIALRALVTNWGEGVRLADVLTLDNFREVLEQPTLVRGIVNTVLIGIVGGGAGGRLLHRGRPGRRIARTTSGRASSTTSCSCRAPCPGCSPAWRSCGCSCSSRRSRRCARRSSASGSPTPSSGSPTACAWSRARCCRSAPSSRRRRAAPARAAARVSRDVTLPLIRYGLLASWLLVFMIFEREYSTGVYLLGPGTEVIGSLLVSLWGTGAADIGRRAVVHQRRAGRRSASRSPCVSESSFMTDPARRRTSCASTTCTSRTATTRS